MFGARIIYKLIFVFIVFAALIMVPFSLTVVKQVEKMTTQTDPVRPADAEGNIAAQKTFAARLAEQVLPYAFYILLMSFVLSIFFLRKMVLSLNHLRQGSLAIKNGDLDARLEIISNDELGDASRAFNEMASSLRKMTDELKKKDVYISAMLDPLWVVDADGNITDINPAFISYLGYSRDEVIGASIYDFFDEKNADIVRGLENEKKSDDAFTCEADILTKEGTPSPVLLSGSPLYSGGKRSGWLGILKDFSEQSRLRNELSRSKDYVETIMNSIEDAIMVIDRNYRIVRTNKHFAGNCDEPAIGDYCYAVSHNSEHPCWQDGKECPAQRVFLTGKNFRTTHEHVGISGERRFHDITASPIMDAAGNVTQVIELVRDVTDRMIHEDEISRKNNELVALNSISGILSKSLRADEIFTKVLDKMTELMKMDGGGIFFIDNVKKEMHCQYHKGLSDEFIKMMGRIRLGEDIPGRVAVTGQIMTTSDLSKDERVTRSIIKHSGIKGYCCIPVRGKERIIGVFSLFSFRYHHFSAEEENILSSIGEMTGIAIENIKLYERMRELYESQRKGRDEEQARLLSLSTQLGSAIELRDVMGQVLELIKSMYGAAFVWMLVNDNEDNYILKSSTSPDYPESMIIYPAGVSSIEGYSVVRKMPTAIADMRSESRFYIHPDLSEMRHQSVISVPMHIGAKAVGVFALYFSSIREFRDEELHFLRIVANLLAVSIERSDFYARAIMEKGLSDTVLQSVAEGIITVDRNGRTLSANKAFERLTGSPVDAVVGRPVCEASGGRGENVEFRMSLAECLEAALEGIKTGRESSLTSPEGRRTSVMISSSPIFGAEGRVTGVVNLVRDISREKEIDRMKTEIIKSVSHELRTPLSAIVGMTEMILSGDVEDALVKKYLNIILSEGVRLSGIVSDLLSIARIEGGNESAKFEYIDMKALLGELAGSFAARLEMKKAVLRTDVGLPGPFVGDAEKIKQLISNLVDNSLVFSDEGCVVEISVAAKSGGVEMSVSDNGWGISALDLPHLTEKFFRGSYSDKVKGTGLGLSICDEIVKMHGGMMSIESSIGKGTKVILYFPGREVI